VVGAASIFVGAGGASVGTLVLVGATVGAAVGVLEPQAVKSSASKTPNIHKIFVLIEPFSFFVQKAYLWFVRKKSVYFIKNNRK
jgi:hypothetical protein